MRDIVRSLLHTRIWSSTPSSNPMNAILINFQQKRAESNAHILGSNASNEKQIDGIFSVVMNEKERSKGKFLIAHGPPRGMMTRLLKQMRAFQHLRASLEFVPLLSNCN
ncbi:hypothetical protein DL98DRAFT_127975 [Cadophora sp. DSE1049]|nr:hypothetical protein DL98DRAFT_127975 [Cadophora sp. DSE1049]